MLQVIEAVLKRPEDWTRISLIFANKTPDDILLKDTLDGLVKRHGSRFKVGRYYMVAIDWLAQQTYQWVGNASPKDYK